VDEYSISFDVYAYIGFTILVEAGSGGGVLFRSVLFCVPLALFTIATANTLPYIKLTAGVRRPKKRKYSAALLMKGGLLSQSERAKRQKLAGVTTSFYPFPSTQ
jgi:hypothetical protein